MKDRMNQGISIAERRQILQQRAERRASSDAGFLHREAARIIAERLAATNRTFTRVAILFEGPFAPIIAETLRKHGICRDVTIASLAWPRNIEDMGVEIIDAEPESFDLLISVFDVFRTIDIEALLLQVNHMLVPDGLFMTCLPAVGSLDGLRRALIETELELSGGAASRVDTFPSAREVGDLLQRCGFKLVVSDVEERTVRYGNLSSLLSDLRSAGGTSLFSAERPRLPGKFASRLQANLAARYADSDGRLPVEANLAFASGWKADPGQQKPLKPGSAKHNLKDFL